MPIHSTGVEKSIKRRRNETSRLKTQGKSSLNDLFKKAMQSLSLELRQPIGQRDWSHNDHRGGGKKDR